MEVNDRERPFALLGKEVEMDVTWCYLEFTGVEAVRSITVRNEVLFEMFDDQSNLVHLYIGKEETSMLLHRGHRTERIEL